MSPGAAAEALAADFLAGRGLTRVERNYRCRGGEIDLIARDGNTLVFVEVRLRATRPSAVPPRASRPANERAAARCRSLPGSSRA